MSDIRGRQKPVVLQPIQRQLTRQPLLKMTLSSGYITNHVLLSCKAVFHTVLFHLQQIQVHLSSRRLRFLQTYASRMKLRSQLSRCAKEGLYGSLPTLVDLQELLIMTFRMAPTDYEMLWIIAEYRIMTSPQLAALLSRSKKGVRDRIGKLIAEGLLEEATRGRGQRDLLNIRFEPGKNTSVLPGCGSGYGNTCQSKAYIDRHSPEDPQLWDLFRYTGI